MAELEALCFIPDRAPSGNELKQSGWRKELPLEKSIKLGRWPRESEWCVEEDRSISRYNADLVWDGLALKVSQPANREVSPIFYHNKATPTFAVQPGESFVIGTTKFTLHSDAPAATPAAPERASAASVGTATAPVPTFNRTTGGLGVQNVDRPVRAESVEDRASLTLKATPLNNADAVLRAFENLPRVLRMADDPDHQLRGLVDILLRAVPGADAASVVYVPPDATDEKPRAIPLCHVLRRSSAIESFMPSRSMSMKAVRGRKSIVRVWTEKEENTLRAGELPGVPWAICIPLQDDSDRCLYVDGGLNREPAMADGKVTDGELLGFQKTVELLASIVESALAVHAKQAINDLLKKFIPQILQGISDQAELAKLMTPRVADVTVLFCDLRGSTKIAEDGSADLMDTWELVSQALHAIAGVITLNGGVVAGFQGDAVMAFWGWPYDDQTDQIANAVSAALRIRNEFDRQGVFSRLECGIGIAHGPAVAGKLGTFDLGKIDVFGPIPNLASRLESLTKQLGVRIIVDEAVADAIPRLPRQDQNLLRIRRLAKVRPVGLKNPTLIYDVMPAAAMPPARLHGWEQAVGEFLDGQWGEARNDFDNYFRNDKAAQLLLRYMEENKGKPPEGWDGTINLDKK